MYRFSIGGLTLQKLKTVVMFVLLVFTSGQRALPVPMCTACNKQTKKSSVMCTEYNKQTNKQALCVLLVKNKQTNKRYVYCV
jgi:hypothetical protein